MTTTASILEFIPRDYDIFVGLDVDKKKMAITCTDHGQFRRSLSMPHSANQLLNYTRKHFAGQRVAFVYEAGPTGFGLYDELTAAQHHCLVVSPSSVPTAPRNKVKTNRLDSKKLSEGLRGGQLTGIHVPPQIYRELRHLVQLRDTQVAQLSATKCRIKSLLLYEGIEFPAANGKWSGRVLRELETLPCNSSVRFKLDRLIDTLQFHFLTAARVQKEIRRFCNAEPELKNSITFLSSLPGVGIITATHATARLGDWREIKNVRQIAGFLGLVSKEDSTGDKVNRGEITRSGDSRLRNKLIQCAWTAIRKDPELRAFYREIYGRQPKKVAARKAIVAVARKLTTRMYAVLKEQRPYVIRTDETIAPLTTEETAGLRDRLDAAQNDEQF
ncbi:MAG TPA: IS110 family transposase [Pyrinomonadaceae bacterium]|nr:IS110 family transposase [Pyrinomonadaceae bacterium]